MGMHSLCLGHPQGPCFGEKHKTTRWVAYAKHRITCLQSCSSNLNHQRNRNQMEHLNKCLPSLSVFLVNNKKSIGNHRRQRKILVGYTRIQVTVVWCPPPPPPRRVRGNLNLVTVPPGLQAQHRLSVRSSVRDGTWWVARASIKGPSDCRPLQDDNCFHPPTLWGPMWRTPEFFFRLGKTTLSDTIEKTDRNRVLEDRPCMLQQATATTRHPTTGTHHWSHNRSHLQTGVRRPHCMKHRMRFYP